ncbi:MAG: hypothetical protein ACUVTM_01305 [Candidatus Bathyarchaeia archaeon]
MQKNSRTCSASCEFFRCDHKSLILKGEATYCRFADDECTPASCKYARCVKGRLLLNGVCGLTLRTRELEVRPEELMDPMEIPGKAVRKVKMKKNIMDYL